MLAVSGWRHPADRRCLASGASRMPVTLACSSGLMLRGALEIVLIAVAEIGRQVCCRASWRTGTSWCRAPPSPSGSSGPLRGHAGVGLVIEPGSGFHQRLGAGEIGLQRGFAERPAGMGHPVARLEIDRVQRPAPAAPVIGAAAQEAQPPRIQRGIVHAGLAPDTSLDLRDRNSCRRIPAAGCSACVSASASARRCRPGRRR